ncbi:LPS export ABC transporter permease LptG [Vibrio sp. SCSIO 43137]|uniref:LPS export ABC transporter permease LptG n=1 Tax=Vibrio sp. SCSIO 43137 TaxID=3021011 RepID=UPI0023078386|nr:LPS export ABC transporter permease LptG [Vibrio sp. SCSIO 43137]WCE30057.1 LPS export ABC transporter permease LptG [Vibrio sp. SCSIO 43137]
MFKILDLYIGRTIIATTSLTLATVVGLSAIIKYVEQLRKVGKGSYDMMEAFYFVLLGIPRDIEMFFPMATLLGSLIALGMLASSSELTVMQAAGFSKLDVGLSVLKTAFPLMLVVMALGEWGSPQTVKMARELRSFALSGGNIVSVRSGVWARDVNDYIFIARIDDEDLNGVNIWRFDPENKLQTIVYAADANYIGDQVWQMNDVILTHMDGDVQLSKEELSIYNWKTTLEPDKLAIVTVKPEELSLSGIYDYVSYLKASEQEASRYELAFWRKLTQPVSIAVMMLLALSFVFGPLRSVTMGARIISGIVAGFTFYISSEFFGPLSIVYQLPAIVGAVAPSLLFLVIAVMLLQRKL